MANYIVSSGITSDGIVLLNDFMTVDNGGKANNTTVDFSGYMYVALGGVANDTIITYLGYVYVLSGGNVNNVNVSNGGYLSIDSGGTATDVSVSSGGSWSFALAPDTYIAGTSDSSAFKIENGRVADLTVNSGCTLNLSSGGTANDTTVNSKGNIPNGPCQAAFSRRRGRVSLS